MFAMNSDLYFDEMASCAGLFLEQELGLFDFVVLLLAPRCSGRPAVGLTFEIFVGVAQLFLLRTKILGQRLGLLEQVLGERVLASIVFRTRPMLSVS